VVILPAEGGNIFEKLALQLTGPGRLAAPAIFTCQMV
jgi:hypothetical protein